MRVKRNGGLGIRSLFLGIPGYVFSLGMADTYHDTETGILHEKQLNDALIESWHS